MVDVSQIQEKTKLVDAAAAKYDAADKIYRDAKAKLEAAEGEKRAAETALKSTLIDAITLAVTSGILVKSDIEFPAG